MYWPIFSGGSYSIYYALAVASKELDADHRFVSYRAVLFDGFATFDHMLTPDTSDLISQMLSLLLILGRSLNGVIRRRLLPWILGVTWFHGPLKMSLKSKTVWAFTLWYLSLAHLVFSRYATNNCYYEGSYEGTNCSMFSSCSASLC